MENCQSTERINTYIEMRSLHSRYKQLVFNHYGSFCIHCYENDTNVLEMDHINNGGCKHRIKDQYSKNIFEWLVKNDYPEGFQVLCVNCNRIKHKNKGVLPEWRKDKYKDFKING